MSRHSDRGAAGGTGDATGVVHVGMEAFVHSRDRDHPPLARSRQPRWPAALPSSCWARMPPRATHPSDSERPEGRRTRTGSRRTEREKRERDREDDTERERGREGGSSGARAPKGARKRGSAVALLRAPGAVACSEIAPMSVVHTTSALRRHSRVAGVVLLHRHSAVWPLGRAQMALQPSSASQRTPSPAAAAAGRPIRTASARSHVRLMLQQLLRSCRAGGRCSACGCSQHAIGSRHAARATLAHQLPTGRRCRLPPSTAATCRRGASPGVGPRARESPTEYPVARAASAIPNSEFRIPSWKFVRVDETASGYNVHVPRLWGEITSKFHSCTVVHMFVPELCVLRTFGGVDFSLVFHLRAIRL
eukprot:COSAG02_NODE_2654_length_8316_cov_4.044161_2_plen_364_part_00